jgi:predicted metal-binding membrane protein
MTLAHSLRLRWSASTVRTLGLIALAWLLAIALNLFGFGSHENILSSPWRILTGILSWLLMVTAMMLPSSLGLLGLMQRAAASQASRGGPSVNQLMLGFVGAYLAVWLGFALIAWIFDAGIHRLTTISSLARANTWMLAPLSLALAGVFQFSSLKGKCLKACRTPASFFSLHYRKGVHGAWRMGLEHGLHCLGCCWALMLVIFAVGSNNLVWMVALTGLTMIERLGPHGDLLRRPIGIGLLLAAAYLGFAT